MKIIFKGFVVIFFTCSCFGVTIQLRKGGTVDGDIVSKNHEAFVIKTSEGKKTFKWKQVKSRCIKEVNPELYDRLKAKGIERRKKKKK